jgi:hypothetical protein
MDRLRAQGRACISCKPSPSIIDRVLKGAFLQALFIYFLSAIAICAPGKAWEESDKQAFEEKIGIIASMIQDHAKSLGSGSGELVPASLRTQCLLQSIGIDVVHRYLEFNPGDALWRQKYVKLREGLTACLYMMYQTQK